MYIYILNKITCIQLIASACDLNARLIVPERASKHLTIASPQPVKTNS